MVRVFKKYLLVKAASDIIQILEQYKGYIIYVCVHMHAYVYVFVFKSNPGILLFLVHMTP